MLDLVRHLNAVEDHVGGGQQVRQGLFLHPVDAGLEDALVLGGFHVVLALVLDGAGKKTASTTGGVHHLLRQLRVYPVHHELGDRPRGVELARVAGTLQVLQQLLVHAAEFVALLGLVEVYPLLELVDDLAQQLAGLHVVVGVLEHVTHHEGGRRLAVLFQVLQAREKVVVDKDLQLIAGHAFWVRRPAAPAQPLRNRRVVVVVK